MRNNRYEEREQAEKGIPLRTGERAARASSLPYPYGCDAS